MSFLIYFTRTLLEHLRDLVWEFIGILGQMRFGPPGGPGRARPARRASLAGWPCLAGRWPAWLAWLASRQARSGTQEQECRPLAPTVRNETFFHVTNN